LRAQLHLAQRAAEERRAALDAEQARAQQLSDYIQQMEQSQQQLQEQLHYAQQQLQQQSSSQHNSPARLSSNGARDDDAQSLSPAMQAAQDNNAQLQAELQRIHGLLRQAQEHATQGDAQIAHLQAELLRLSSAPAPNADASTPGGADVSALHAQIAQLQAQVEQQAAQSVEDKRRTQAILADKLEQVRTVILSKDAVIVKLKQQLAQIQGQAGLYNHEPDTPSPQRAQQQQQPHQHSPAQQQQHLPPPPLPPAHGYQPSHAQAPLSHYPPPQFASPSSVPHSAAMPIVHKQRV
jgi:chromosome segregation ATPase